MATKEKLDGRRTVQPGNYRKGPWDSVSEKALDTEASHSIADGNLKQFDEADAQMDTHQEVGYAYVRIIANGEIPAQDMPQAATQALIAFGLAERWESLNEENVADGHSAVLRARQSNHVVVGLAEGHRKVAAQAQRNGAVCHCGEAA